MGGGSEFPLELMKAVLDGLAQNAVQEPTEKNWEKKQDNRKDRKHGRGIEIKEFDNKETEKEKEKVMKAKESSKVGKLERQPESSDMIKCTEENRRQIQSKDKGEEKKKDRQKEKRKQKEMVLNGWESSRTAEWHMSQHMCKVLEDFDGRVNKNVEQILKDKEKRMKDLVKSVMKERKELAKSERENAFIKDEGKVLENLEERTEVKDEKKNKNEKKHKEREKRVKEHIKKGKKDKKEVPIPEVENDNGKDELLDNNLPHNDKKDSRKDKGWYTVGKLKNKLAKLDAKMEKIAAKSEIYSQRLKEAQKPTTIGGEVVDDDQESIVDRPANKMDLQNVPSTLKTGLPEVSMEVTFTELQENISERISYPNLEDKDMTGAGY